jgi:hypothetical protein
MTSHDRVSGTHKVLLHLGDFADDRWGVGRRNPEVRMSPVNLVLVAVFEADCLKVGLEEEFRVILPRDPLATRLDGQRHALREQAWRSTCSR